ncbi:hypothetical protein KC947_03015 [Candidatus Saccharibacteria bacterium]|nr:hypothetical protein [Candidatus Saccharibacteria bacterium]
MDQFKKPQISTKTQVRQEPARSAITAEAPVKKNKLLTYGLAVVLVVVLGAGVFFGKQYLSTKNNTLAGVDSSKIQALFLANGQVYFGRISLSDKNTIRISDIYYLQVAQKVQPDNGDNKEANAEPQLIKLGEELHGPEDTMFINRDQVTFWENLKDNSKVVEAIRAYRKN